MATVVKDFKIKSGLVVEGTTGKINNFDILTKKQDDQDYIVSLIGGTATPQNTPNTVVKRDANGNFAAQEVQAFKFNIGSVGYIEDDGSIEIVNTDGDDINLRADDIRLDADDDVILDAGDDLVLTALTGNIRLQGPNIYAVANDNTDPFTDSDRVATQGYVDDAIEGIDLTFNTDEITEGNTNRYFSEELVDDHISGTYPIEYDAGAISLALGTGGGLVTDEGGLYVNRTVVDTWYDANGAAATAQSNAEDYTNTAIGTEVTNRNDAIATAKSEAISAAEDYADTAVGNIVGAAPELLNTLQELAAALENDPDIIADLQDVAAGKQDTLTAGSNIDITGSTISVTGLDTADVAEDSSFLYFTNQRALDATSAAYDIAGAAQTAYSNAVSDAAFDATSKANTAQDNANDYTNQEISSEVTNRNNAITSAIDALNTDAIEEGATNQYFTDARAKDAAADLLTGATLSNITITGNGAGLTITAENGVAGSTTNDLAEGTGVGANLYFTDTRAVDALQGTDSMFNTVSIDEVALQVASSLSAPTAGVQTAYAWDKDDYRSAEFLVKVAYGTHTEISKVLLTLDTSDNIAITEYGIVGTNGSASTISAGISGTDVQLLVTTANNSSTVTVVGTLLA